MQRTWMAGPDRGPGTGAPSVGLGAAGVLLAAVLAVPFSAYAGAASGGAEKHRSGEIQEVSIVVAGEPYSGTLVPPATDSGFQFRLSETGDVLAFRWSSLEPSERKRIQRLFGIQVEDGHLAWGKKIPCVRFKLKSKKFVEGRELPERALPGYRCLKTATQIMQIAKRDVVSVQPIEKRESDIYSAEEAYEQLLLEKPPAEDSARDHLQYARTCANMGLYDKAIDHIEMAKAIDPRTEERTKEFRTELVAKYASQQAEKLYLRLLGDLHRGDNASALDKINRIKRNFPNSEYYTKVDSLQTKVAADKETDFAKQVILMYYTLTNELIHKKLSERKRVDLKGRPVPSNPGKQITTRQGHIFRGVLVSDTEELVTLKSGDTNIEIPAKDIMSKQDVDLSRSARQVDIAFAELKAYVTDPEGGLGKDIITKISERLKVDEGKVRDTWSSRFNRTATYKDGVLVKTPIYASLHEAFYDRGSWLRDGVQPMQARQGGRRGGRNGGGRRTSGGRRQGQSGSSNLVQDPSARKGNPDDSDDPEVWWSAQSIYLKYNILKAFAAEKLFRVTQRYGDACPTCGGKGFITVSDAFGSMRPYRCPTCRGLRKLARIVYK